MGLIFFLAFLLAGGFLAAAICVGFLAWRCWKYHLEKTPLILFLWVGCALLFLCFVVCTQFAGSVYQAAVDIFG